MSQTPGPLSVAVDPVALVVTECITVTSAMRKHARWAHSSVSAILGGGVTSAKAVTDSARQSFSEPREKDSKDVSITITDDSTLASRWGLRGKRGQSMQDNPLLSAFARLRSNLKGCKGSVLPHRQPRCIAKCVQTSMRSRLQSFFIHSSKSFVPPRPRRQSPH